jgi:hypothetical protein
VRPSAFAVFILIISSTFVACCTAELMDRMDVARSTSITPPEWAFEEARRKIDAGHYSFAVDAPAKPKGPPDSGG